MAKSKVRQQIGAPTHDKSIWVRTKRFWKNRFPSERRYISSRELAISVRFWDQVSILFFSFGAISILILALIRYFYTFSSTSKMMDVILDVIWLSLFIALLSFAQQLRIWTFQRNKRRRAYYK